MIKCSLCGEPVFGLRGQDDFVSSALAGAVGEELPDDVVGDCHMKCLMSSHIASRLYRIRSQFLSGQMRRTQLAPGLELYVNPSTLDVVVLQSDGVSLNLTRKQLRMAKSACSFSRLRVEHEHNLYPLDDLSVVNRWQKDLKREGRISIITCLSDLNILDKLLNREGVEDGYLIYEPSLERHWTPTSLSVTARYALVLPTAVANYFESTGGEVRE